MAAYRMGVARGTEFERVAIVKRRIVHFLQKYLLNPPIKWGLVFSKMNSAAVPTVMQLGAVGLAEQSGSAGTDQQGDPFAEVQLRIADDVILCRNVHP
ncbi:MAG TPA: hypothetical protein VFO40_03950 [Chthoniobacterales bacterium]|nr:hypothetical protein [Chthoniobacterales bacterium]